ncbi:MAG: glycosyltransferase family 4 protein [Promethearchaeota archaeon]
MKIGINSRVFQNGKGGISFYIKCLYEELLKIDKKNSYVFFPEKEKDIKNVKVMKTFNEGQLGAFLFDNFSINSLVKKERIDLFHGPSNILPIRREKGVRYVITVHDLAFLMVPQSSNFLYKRYYKLALGQSLRNADIVVADSQSTRDDIIRFYKIPESKIKVVYLGVDSAFLEAGHKERIIKGKYFFSITTHPKRKNILSILNVIAENKKLLTYKYVIAGLMPNKQILELKNRIKKLRIENNIILFGYARKKELISLYQHAAFFIYPSFYEGFGFPVLEAMACGCPVITSNNSSLIEITPNKEWLIDPYNIEDISNKIDRILNLSDKERDELIKNNYNFVKNFTWDKTAKEMLGIFESLK